MSEEGSTPGSDAETVEDSLGELVQSYRRPRGRGGVGGEMMGLARRYSQIVSKFSFMSFVAISLFNNQV